LDNTIGGDTVRAFQHPIGDIPAAEGPKEMETDAVEGLIHTHMTSHWQGVICREDRAVEGSRNNNQHQKFLVVLNALENHKAVVDNNSHAIAAPKIVSIGRVDLSKRESGCG
jgi:hypothetical protein